jgi:hypothetical protein
MALLNEQVADECYYALPARGGDHGDDKPIEGAPASGSQRSCSARGGIAEPARA